MDLLLKGLVDQILEKKRINIVKMLKALDTLGECDWYRSILLAKSGRMIGWKTLFCPYPRPLIGRGHTLHLDGIST